MDVPNIDGLLGQIAQKRHDLPKAPIQSVQIVQDQPAKHKDVKTAKQQNAQTTKPQTAEARGVGGRPSQKKPDVEYVKLSPKIPLELKQKVVDALNYKRYQDEEGNVIKTMDEFVALAIERLLRNNGNS